FHEFILPLGFGGDQIRSYFSVNPLPADQRIVFVETGEHTLKGGRVKRVSTFLKKEHFHLTYGDGVANVDLRKLHAFHLTHGQMATVTAVRPPSRFGELVLKGNTVRRFIEKPQLSSGNINGGFFVFRRDFLDLLTTEEDCDLEFGALQN